MLFYVVGYKHQVQVQPIWKVDVGFGSNVPSLWLRAGKTTK